MDSGLGFEISFFYANPGKFLESQNLVLENLGSGMGIEDSFTQLDADLRMGAGRVSGPGTRKILKRNPEPGSETGHKIPKPGTRPEKFSNTEPRPARIFSGKFPEFFGTVLQMKYKFG